MLRADLVTLIEPVLALARAAGEAIMEIYDRGNVKVSNKADGSPLTEADLAANRILVQGLAQLCPGVPILSEESKLIDWSERRDWQSLWLVDPLDGTKEFVKRNGEFTVNVALIVAGAPVFGVVHAPALARSYWGGPDLDAHSAAPGSTPTAIQVGADPGVGENLRVVASRSHRSAELEKYLSKLPPHDCVGMGSSLKLCLVADGQAHHYPRIGPTMEWDTAAAHAVVLGAGGSVVDLQGEPLRYNKEDLLNPFFLVRNRP